MSQPPQSPVMQVNPDGSVAPARVINVTPEAVDLQADAAATQQAAAAAARNAAQTAVRDLVARTEKVDQVVFSAPRTAREVEGLNVRRDLLRQQLERAEDRRQELTRQLQRVGDPEDGRAADPASTTALRAGLELRLRDADARVIQLERDIAATERALTQAGPEVLAQYEQQRPRPPVQQGAGEDEVLGLLSGGFLLGMLVLTLARRIRAWRRRRRGQPAFDGAPAGVGPDPRIDRLTQAVDAIAVEVERIGEGQRFVTQLMAERRELVPAEVGRTADVPGVR